MHAPPTDPAARAWRVMSSLVLDEDRRTAASDALGLSFARIRTLRRLVDEPLTLRELAARLGADPPYVTLMIDDLEQRGLVVRTTHPQDRRAKLVALTPEGRTTADRADAILHAPPAALTTLPPGELTALAELLERAAAQHAN